MNPVVILLPGFSDRIVSVEVADDDHGSESQYEIWTDSAPQM
jgi:hypothetical protein